MVSMRSAGTAGSLRLAVGEAAQATGAARPAARWISAGQPLPGGLRLQTFWPPSFQMPRSISTPLPRS